ncbi:Peptidoglycan/LPS O-acetylase OafA/YrhL, contains acyltransferase and SGNH-hydrolase domains [Hyphomicrobium facile]|uniref:Peptidoglycan/LPS O-acetylase OafA/YrhL, contains acyltransferase and SGNH-hydrolase domains n=2 Tax=Hyphomicrobium facile TaxID=51670 RepID=A0A1I7N3S2_9HYPH|nr:Peptidoglycan/LPS O-acetylase OafA/YrhL, contains acyltransferase and SGNH-hydrolase domains [Hyphomicrobium facile]
MHGRAVKTHRSDIDGLRAVAILGVLAFHFGLGGVTGGYGGVDVFFVISGFLIAGIIKSELEAGTFSLTHFYVRRIRRILPALTVCLAATTLAAAFILFPRDFQNYGRSLLAAALSLSNFYFSVRNGYFDGAATEKPLLHTWSLAVEEQFYIVFPVALILLFKLARKSVLSVLAAIAALSLAYSSFSVARSPDPAFFSTLGRVWELGTGTLLAFAALPLASRRWAIEAEAGAGVLLIAFGYFFYDDNTLFPGLAALPLCFGAALIIHSGMSPQKSFVARLLSSPPMVGIGLISYSIYLWHWPLLVLCQYRFPDVFGADAPHATAARMGLAIASLGLGALSWRFIEEPFRRSGGILTKTVFGAGASAVLAIAATSAVVIGRPNWLHRWPAAIDAMQFRRTVSGRVLGLKREPEWPHDTYRVGNEGSTPDTVLWGDSFAQALIPGFITYYKKTGKGAVIAANPGCPPLPSVTFYGRSPGANCKPRNNAIFKAVAARGIRRVILVARWEGFASAVVRDGDGNPAVYTKHGNADGAVFASTLEDVVRRLAAQDKDVVILGPVPIHRFDVGPTMARHIAWGLPLPPELALQEFTQNQRLVLPVLARLATIPHVRVVYPHLSLCDGKTCRYSDDGKPMYSDAGHLSPNGVATLSQMFDELFNGAAKSEPPVALQP